MVAERCYSVAGMNSDGGRDKKVVSRDCVPLEEGKGSWAFFEACRPCLGTLHQEGHESAGLHYYCFDGALYSKFVRSIAQHHELVHEKLWPDPDVRAIQESPDCVATRQCAGHFGHNSLTRGARRLGMFSISTFRWPWKPLTVTSGETSSFQVVPLGPSFVSEPPKHIFVFELYHPK